MENDTGPFAMNQGGSKHFTNSDPSSIEPYLMKVFDNVKLLSFSRGNSKIVGLKSSEGEHVQLLREVGSTGPVEIWMKNLEEEIVYTVKENERIYFLTMPFIPKKNGLKIILECAQSLHHKFDGHDILKTHSNLLKRWIN